MYNNGVEPQVLPTLVTAPFPHDNTKYQHGNKYLENIKTSTFGKVREREIEREER